MWDYYKRTFVMVQVATLAVSYLVYRNSNHAVIPSLVFFTFMQLSAVFGAMWANRLRRKIQAADRA
jgi:hypothetical protein